VKVGDLVGAKEEIYELGHLCGVVCQVGARKKGHYIMVKWNDGAQLWHKREHLKLLNKI